jgi:hypothetical protein
MKMRTLATRVVHLAGKRRGSVLVLVIAVAALTVGFFAQPKPTSAATGPSAPAITISVAGTQYSEIYNSPNPNNVTLIATKGTPVLIETDTMGATISSCHFTLISSSRGVLFDRTSPTGITGCPVPNKPFKVAGSPGSVEFITIEQAVTYTDTWGNSGSMTDTGLLQVATAAW